MARTLDAEVIHSVAKGAGMKSQGSRRTLRDFFIGLHVLTRHRYLVGDLLQEPGVCFGVLVLDLAHQAERAKALAEESRRSRAFRLHTFGAEAALIGVLLLLFNIAAEERPLVMEHPPAPVSLRLAMNASRQ